jgi:hypothetical protein
MILNECLVNFFLRPGKSLFRFCLKLEEGRRADEKQEAEQENEQDIPAEDNAVEMTDDFDGRLHDGDQKGLD